MRVLSKLAILTLTVFLFCQCHSATVSAASSLKEKSGQEQSAKKADSAKKKSKPAKKTESTAVPKKTDSDDTKKESNSESQEDEEQEGGTFKKLEDGVDGVAGWCVGKIAAVFFYEIGKSSHSGTVKDAAADLKLFKKSYAAVFKAVAKRDKIDLKKKGAKSKVKLTAKDIESLAKQNALASFKSFVDEAEEAGYDPKETDFEISLPKKSLTKLELAAFKRVLNAKFTAGRTRGFSVKLRDDESNATDAVAVQHGVSAIVLWLVFGAVFFTLRMGFINFRGFKHAIKVTAGKYDNPDDKGEVTHFQALTAALSATVGLGNIAGVAIAVMTGGPGATFWMIVAGLLGMSAKFTECTLGQKYREVRADGRIMGGAMYYLSNGLKEKGFGGLGRILAGLFAVLCVLASFGGGNAFQVNQSLRAVEQSIPWLQNNHIVYGLIMAVLVGVVIIGGIRRIAATAEKIVPLMCGVYILACMWILLMNLSGIPAAFQLIFTEAFTPRAGFGGLLGVLIMGFRRAAFSNEAGVGSAAIAHSAAKTDYPVREGIVALLEPFIDTVIICTMTALVIVITGAYSNPEYSSFVADNNGAGLTSAAMGGQVSWFPAVLSVAVVLFAYSTMISWSYYGERCWTYLFGDRSSMTYRILFLVVVVLGSIMSATNVLDLSDLMILGMAFPNILGLLFLAGMVRHDLNVYWKKLKDGEFDKKQESPDR